MTRLQIRMGKVPELRSTGTSMGSGIPDTISVVSRRRVGCAMNGLLPSPALAAELPRLELWLLFPHKCLQWL
jgi:hypothetical protein